MAKKVEFYNSNSKIPNKKNSKGNQRKELITKKTDIKVNENLHEVEKKVLEAVSNQSTTFDIDILKPTFLDRILRRTIKTYKVKKVVFAQVTMISRILLDIPSLNLKGLNSQEILIEAITLAGSKEIDKILEIITIFLEGAKEPSKKTIKFLSENLDMKEIFDFVSNIISNAGYMDFIYTTLLIQNKMQLKTAAE